MSEIGDRLRLFYGDNVVSGGRNADWERPKVLTAASGRVVFRLMEVDHG